MSIRLPFADLSRLLAALAFGIVLMTASSCGDCDEEACKDYAGDAAHCCHLVGKSYCFYEIGFRDGNGNLEFMEVFAGFGFNAGYRPPDGYTCQDKISESCVRCGNGRTCP